MWTRAPRSQVDVANWWCEIREFYENPRETNANFSVIETYHRRHKTKDAWYAIMHRLIGQRWFMGYMTQEEVAAQEMIFTQFRMRNSFFVYLDISGEFVLSHSVLRNRGTHREMNICPSSVGSDHEQYRDKNEWENIFSDIERTRDDPRWGCRYPLDRGNALIFKKEIDRRMRAAVKLWTLLGMRAGIPKDIRVLVAKLVWGNRCDWIV